MAKYVLTYSGGSGFPETEAEQADLMAAWGNWFAQLGDAIVDGGAPFGETMALAPDGVSSAVPANTLTGYSIVEADDMKGALKHASTCPVLAGGGTVNVSTVLDM